MSTAPTDASAGPSPADDAGTLISTVTGSRSAAELGSTLVLEHVIARLAERATAATAAPAPATAAAAPDDLATESWPLFTPAPSTDEQRTLFDAPLDMPILGDLALGAANRENLTLTDESLVAAELAQFRDAGGATIVDATSIGLGRDPQALARIAEATGLAIIMGSGWYHPALSPELHGRSVESLTDDIVADLTNGIDGIRSGIIGRLAPLDVTVDAERTLLVAAARAHVATGAPIYLDHSAIASAGSTSTERTIAALALLRDEGADPSRIAVTNCGPLSTDVDALTRLTETGAFVVFDRIGRLKSIYQSWDDHNVAAALGALVKQGLTSHVLLSPGIREKIDLTAFGGTGYAFIPRQFGMFLGWQGVDEAALTQITVENPRRLLTGTTGTSGASAAPQQNGAAQ